MDSGRNFNPVLHLLQHTSCISCTIRSVAFFPLFAICVAFAQTQESILGEVRLIPISANAAKCDVLQWSTSNGVTLIFWTPGDRELTFVQIDTAASLIHSRHYHSTTEIDSIIPFNFSEDGNENILVVSKEERLISILTEDENDSISISETYKVPFDPSNIVVADINNDRHPDLLIFDRNIPGILPYLSDRKGHCRPGKIIAPDNMVGAVACTDLNSDHILDIVLYDWVKSEVHMLYGVGRGRFLDQSTFPIDGEVKKISVAPSIIDYPIQLFFVMKNSSHIQLWEGNELGDFRLMHKYTYDNQIIDNAFIDINGDELQDGIFLTGSPSVMIALNNGDGFLAPVEYGTSVNPTSIFASPRTENQSSKIYVWNNKNQTITVYFQGDQQIAARDTVLLSAGAAPVDVFIHDCNNDRINDIVVANKQSKSISMYWGRSGLFPSGPTMHSIANLPEMLAYHYAVDSISKMLISYPGSTSVSYLTLEKDGTVNEAIFPTEGISEILRAEKDPKTNIDFVTLNLLPSSDISSLSFYEQLSPSKFIERTFRLPPPALLLGADVADINRDSLLDIVYAYRSADTGAVELGIAFGDSTFSMKRRIISQEFRLPESSRMFLWLADMNHNDTMDLVFYTGAPFRQLWFAQGKEDSLFSNPVFITSGINISSRSQLKIVDADLDGRNDIVVVSNEKNAILWFRSLTDSTFDSEKIIYRGTDINHFAIGDVNGDGKNDLVIPLSKEGNLKIVSGTVWLKQTEHEANRESSFQR